MIMGLLIIGCSEISLVARKLEMIKHSWMCKCLALLLHCSGHDTVHLSWEGWTTCFGETRSLATVLALLVHLEMAWLNLLLLHCPTYI